MRFQSMLPVALFAFIDTSIVSAQTETYPPVPVVSGTPLNQIPLSCFTCMNNATDTVPACKGVPNNSSINGTDPSQLDPAAKICFCTLVSSTNWLQTCVSSTVCPQSFLTGMSQEFAIQESTYCKGIKINANGGEAMMMMARTDKINLTLLTVMSVVVDFWLA